VNKTPYGWDRNLPLWWPVLVGGILEAWHGAAALNASTAAEDALGELGVPVMRAAHLHTPLAGPDGDLVDFYALELPAGVLRLLYEPQATPGQTATMMAERMGCEVVGEMLRRDIPVGATTKEEMHAALGFIAAAVTLATRGELVNEVEATSWALMAWGGEAAPALWAEFDNGTTVEVRPVGEEA